MASFIELDLDFEETEKGNILITHTEEFYLNSWIRLGRTTWLEISYRSDNYPSFTTSVVQLSERDLATHIRKTFGGGTWTARKMCIEGVEVDSKGIIIGDEDKEEEEEEDDE